MDTNNQEPKVIEREDGFFGVEGLPTSSYYATREVAERVAKALGEKNAADAAASAAEDDGEHHDDHHESE